MKEANTPDEIRHEMLPVRLPEIELKNQLLVRVDTSHGVNTNQSNENVVREDTNHSDTNHGDTNHGQPRRRTDGWDRSMLFL